VAKIRVMLADDHAVLRTGLRLLINTQSDLEVVAEAGDFAEALHQTHKVTPDVLILDLTMPGGNGIPMIEKLRAASPKTRVLVLTMHDDPAYVRAALAAGAFGYVVKKAADSELLSAVRAVARGRAFVDVEVGSGGVRAVLNEADAERGASFAGPLATLSPREREVLQWLAHGHTNQAIADRLSLSVKSIESYRARLLDKLGLKSRADLIRFAVEMGLLGPGSANPPANGVN